MPLVSTSALLLRRRGRVIFFLQSSSSVTFFFETERAMRCHLDDEKEHMWSDRSADFIPKHSCSHKTLYITSTSHKLGFTGYWLAISQINVSEQRIVLGGWLAILVLIQEDRWASHFDAELLDALLTVDGQEEGLESSLGLDQGHDGKVFRESTLIIKQKGNIMFEKEGKKTVLEGEKEFKRFLKYSFKPHTFCFLMIIHVCLLWLWAPALQHTISVQRTQI